MIKDATIVTPADLISYVKTKKSEAERAITGIGRQLAGLVDTIELNDLERKAHREHKILIKNFDDILDSLDRMKNNSQEDQKKTVSFHVNYSKGTKAALTALERIERCGSAIGFYYSNHADQDKPMLAKLQTLIKNYHEETEDFKLSVEKYLKNKNYARAAMLLVDFAPVDTAAYFTEGSEYTHSPKTENQLQARGQEISEWCQEIMEKKIPPQHLLSAEVTWYTDEINAEQRRLAEVNDDVLASIAEASPYLSEKEAPMVQSIAVQRLNKLSKGLGNLHQLITTRRQKETALNELRQQNSAARDLGGR